MHRTVLPAFLFGFTSFVPYASAAFGFTSGSFDYVQLSSPQVIAWNGQTGEVELRMMVYPADEELSYLPIAANLSGNSYTWLPTSISTGSQWTLEGVDEGGNIAALGTPFTIQGAVAPGLSPVSTSLLQQNPQSTAQATPSTDSASSAATSSASAPTNPNNDGLGEDGSIPTRVKIAIYLAALLGAAGIATLSTFFILRSRQKKGKSTYLNPFRSKKRPQSNLPFELQDNASIETLAKPTMELQGSPIEGSSDTSHGQRMELGFGNSWRKSTGKRCTIAPGAVETSMGKRYELG